MDNLSKTLSSALRLLRSQRGWSLDAASQKTGVSKAMLGQIERGESSPTIASLWKIAKGFDVSFSSLIEDLNLSQASIPRKEGFRQIHKSEGAIRIMPLFLYDKDFGFEVFIIELLPGCEHISEAHQAGVVEHVIVSSGRIELGLHGIWHSIGAYEGFAFKADQPHIYRNSSSMKAIFQNIIHYPKP